MLIGIAVLLTALACSYLMLAEPSAAARRQRRSGLVGRLVGPIATNRRATRAPGAAGVARADKEPLVGKPVP